MKKIAAIFILGTLLFNWCGYRWVIGLLQQKADVQLEAKLDSNDYDENSLIEIRVPLNMPYQLNQSDFERCDGQVEYKGIHYKFVKRRIDNGQLVLKCIPNQTRQRLQTARDDFFRLVNDLQQEHSSKKTNTNIAKNSLGDYDDYRWQYKSAFSTTTENQFSPFNLITPNRVFRATPAQPPEC